MTEVLNAGIFRWISIVALGIFFGFLIYRVFARFLKEMDGSEKNPRPGVWIEANWGGLGGGLSGWRVSNAIIYLLLMSLLLGCLSLAVVSLNPATGTKQEAKKEESQDEQKKDTGKKDAGKKEDKNEKKEFEPTASGFSTDTSTGEKNLKKSSNAPAAEKKAEK